MVPEGQLIALIDLIYEAALDIDLWPNVLEKIADTTGTVQAWIASADRQASVVTAIAPATPVYNEWFRPAGFGLAMMGANLHASGEASALIAIANAPGKDQITGEQAVVFKAVLPHIDRAVRIHRQLRICDLNPVTAPEMLEKTDVGVILVDGAAKVLYANAWARALLTPRSGLTVKNGYLFSIDRAASLHQLIASCRACHSHAPGDFGGAIALRRTMRRPLRVTVTPLRARGTELPWLGLSLPVAMITISDPAMAKRPKN